MDWEICEEMAEKANLNSPEKDKVSEHSDNPLSRPLKVVDARKAGTDIAAEIVGSLPLCSKSHSEAAHPTHSSDDYGQLKKKYRDDSALDSEGYWQAVGTYLFNKYCPLAGVQEGENPPTVLIKTHMRTKVASRCCIRVLS